jgi:hypothetical protein
VTASQTRLCASDWVGYESDWVVCVRLGCVRRTELAVSQTGLCVSDWVGCEPDEVLCQTWLAVS